MTLVDLKNALLAVSNKTYHFSGIGATPPYIVWAEDGQADAVWADGKMQEQVMTGTIDLFTKTEYDPLFNAIQTALNGIDISYRLESIQYEEDTKLIHYEWSWELV